MKTTNIAPLQLKISDFEDKTLLIVDDDDPLRGRLSRAMEKKGFSVKEAKTVKEGLNIVKNAMQAIDVQSKKSAITISSRIAYSKPINGRVFSTICQIDILDNGPGIPIDIQEQVFFPMMSTKDDGSGLGLSIAQDIIRIHGGSIAFSSKPGNTVFSILLPMSSIQLKGVANA